MVVVVVVAVTVVVGVIMAVVVVMVVLVVAVVVAIAVPVTILDQYFPRRCLRKLADARSWEAEALLAADAAVQALLAVRATLRVRRVALGLSLRLPKLPEAADAVVRGRACPKLN